MSSQATEPILNTAKLTTTLQNLAPTMASSLSNLGYWTNLPPSNTSKASSSMDTQQKHLQLVNEKEVYAMRNQSIALRNQGRFEQSWSESIDSSTGKTTSFDKEGVFACEPDGGDYDIAPDLLLYMSTMIGMLPPLLNDATNNISSSSSGSNNATGSSKLNLSNQAFNAKLAVTSPGGSVYPLHVDNTLGVNGSPQDDTRKLTCILYLNNPTHNTDVDGGELRLLVHPNQTKIDLCPVGGRMVLFWSDEIPHEVLPTAPTKHKSDEMFDRYALTIWIPDLDPRNIQPKGSKFESLRLNAFTK